MGFISAGDFIDLFYKIKTRGYQFILGKASVFAETRTRNTWNHTDDQSSNWWIIEPVRKRWNKLITGNEATAYEDYIATKYLSGKNNISLLSVGCGNGDHEITFANNNNITNVTAIDIAAEPLKTAKEKAEKLNLKKIRFLNTSFQEFNPTEKFDIILFHSSLHHFKHMEKVLLKVNHLLNDKGLVIINEYAGPNMFQFGKERKAFLNTILKNIPENLKLRVNSKNRKTKIYEPGIIRMYIADPSEACRSSDIMNTLNRLFEVLEEKKTGGDILHFLLKDIAQNFLTESPKTTAVLENLFSIEDDYIAEKEYSDFMFGVYQKKSQTK
jgi:ubiquinone/menaquinone biosynthesis C-methylase UbiE